MIDCSPKNLRTLSILGQRRTIGSVLYDLAKDNEKIFALTADQAALIALNRFEETYPERYLNLGISEQNAVGVASGLANEGFVPFLIFQAAFTSFRCTDQIKVNMSYMKSPVKLVGIFSGLTLGDCGPTHYDTQDIALMRTMPNITVLSPADTLETAKMVEACANLDIPVYIRLSGEINSPIVYREDYDFEIGKAITLKDGSDVAIIATGTMVNNSLKASKILEEQGISTKVVNMHTIKPLDVEAIKECCNAKLIVTVEEHSIYGGLGGAVSEVLAQEKIAPQQLIIGLADVYEKAGEYPYLIEKYGLNPEQIAEKIIRKYKGE